MAVSGSIWQYQVVYGSIRQCQFQYGQGGQPGFQTGETIQIPGGRMGGWSDSVTVTQSEPSVAISEMMTCKTNIQDLKIFSVFNISPQIS